ncbi:MAG TPA: hypothetical protein VGD64_11670 [Acidisarcina sp.]
MAWTESYQCDVCNKAKGEDEQDWWLAWTEVMAVPAESEEQPVLKLTPWSHLLSHSVGVKHLCGARCAQTQMDRWMSKTIEE